MTDLNILTADSTPADITRFITRMQTSLPHIDWVARQLGRDVVYVSFEPENPRHPERAPFHYYSEYASDENRRALIRWLEDNKIEWAPVGHFASENSWSAYSGNIYIHVAYAPGEPQYELVRDHLETESGEMRDPRVKFWLTTVSDAMKNAHHDEPGFWERWAENF